MNIIDKIKKSWWVILSFIMFINGFGFIYVGARENNKNWILEGIIYELPWFIYFIFFTIYGIKAFPILNPSSGMVLIGFLLMLVSIVRSIWVAVKLADVYDNEEKYSIQVTELKRNNDSDDNKDSLTSMGCCLCIIAIFILFLVVVL